MKDKKEIRVGLIGNMFMGVAHSNAFRNAGIWYDLPFKIKMQCVCAKDSDENLAAFADKFGWESYEHDWKALVSRDDIDVVSVATPGFLHKEMVLEAIKNNKHVFCEKPLANTLQETLDMKNAAESAGIIHCCGFSYRFSPALALAKQFVDEGKIGNIYQVYARYAQDWPSEKDFPLLWRFDKKLSGSGSLGDLCSHIIDATRFATGLSFKKVVGNLTTLIKERPLDADDVNGEKGAVTVDDIAQCLCHFDNGATGSFEATRLAKGRKNNNCIEINGEKGSLVWNFEEQNYLYYYDNSKPDSEKGFTKINATHDSHPYGGGPWPQGHGIGYADTFVIEMANYLKAVYKNVQFKPGFDDGYKCQLVLDAIERSAEKQCWINLD